MNSICSLIIARKNKRMKKKKDLKTAGETVLKQLKEKQIALEKANDWNEQEKIIIAITKLLQMSLKKGND